MVVANDTVPGHGLPPSIPSSRWGIVSRRTRQQIPREGSQVQSTQVSNHKCPTNTNPTLQIPSSAMQVHADTSGSCNPPCLLTCPINFSSTQLHSCVPKRRRIFALRRPPWQQARRCPAHLRPKWKASMEVLISCALYIYIYIPRKRALYSKELHVHATTGLRRKTSL